jgi:hypothetical protein
VCARAVEAKPRSETSRIIGLSFLVNSGAAEPITHAQKNPDENIQKAKEFFLAKDLAKDNAAAPAAAAPSGGAAKMSKTFTEDDVNKRVDEVIAERTKDGAFVFHDPKLDADLNLNFEQIKVVRGMEGYGWFANVIFHDKDEAKKQYAIDFWFKPDGNDLKLMDIRVQKGPKQDGDSYYMVTRLPVAWWWLPIQELCLPKTSSAGFAVEKRIGS